MTTDVADYIRSKGRQVKYAGANEIHTSCFWCGEDPHKRGRLYISTDPNQMPPAMFHCKLCGKTGALNAIRKFFKDPALNDDGEPFGSKPERQDSQVNIELLNSAAAYYNVCLSEHLDIYAYLKEVRGLLPDTIEHAGLGYSNGTLFDYLKGQGFSEDEIFRSKLVSKESRREFLYGCVTIPYRLHGQTVLIRGRDMAPGSTRKYLTPPEYKSKLYNADDAWNATEVIVTEGEFDALVLKQWGYTAVGVSGSSAWQEGWSSYLTDAKRIYVCFDNDGPGNSGADKLIATLGPKSRKIELPPGLDVSDYVVKQGVHKDEFQGLIRAANSSIMLQSVEDAYARWKLLEGNPDLKGLSTGFEVLDNLIKPGLLPGQVAVLLARTGSGKTLLIMNMFHRILTQQPDKKILFISLEQTSSEWYERAQRIYTFYHPEVTKMSEVKNFYIDRFRIIDENRLSEDEVYACIDDFEYALGGKPDIIFIDYLGYWASSYAGEGYERTTKAVMALKKIAKDTGVPIIAPHQVNRAANSDGISLTSGRDAGTIEETADFLWTLNTEPGQDQKAPDPLNPQKNNSKFADKSLAKSVSYSDWRMFKQEKSRHGGIGQGFRIRLAPGSLVMVPEVDVKNVSERSDLGMIAKAERERMWLDNAHKENVPLSFRDILLKHKLRAKDDLMPGWRQRLGTTQEKEMELMGDWYGLR